MGNCIKTPRTNSNENIHQMRGPPLPPINNQSYPPFPPNQNPGRYPPQYPINPVYPNRMQPAQSVPNGLLYPNQRIPVPNYSISSIPLNGPGPVASLTPMISTGQVVKRFSRIIDGSVVLTKAEGSEFWINFDYTAKYTTTISMYCFAREQFDKTKNTHVYHIDTNSLPKPQNFTVPPQDSGHFINQYKINLANISQNILEISDRCTYPIIIELFTKSPENHSQILITKFKISKEHEIHTPVMVKQTMKMDNEYRELFNLFGTSEVNQEAECLICLTEKRTIAVMPCRHVCFCPACVGEIKKNNKLDCPVCRSRITDFLNIQHS